MTTHERAPLDAEERALAALLARHAPEGGPSPELDARILTLAREGDGARAASTATGVPSAPVRASRARRRRWPAMLGVAASLALAVGVAWQLRPLPEPGATLVPQAEPAPVAALRVPTQPETPAQTRAAPATSPALPEAPGTAAESDSDPAPSTARQAGDAPAAASAAPPERVVAPPASAAPASAPTPAPTPALVPRPAPPPAPPAPADGPDASPQTVHPAPTPASGTVPPPSRPAVDAAVPRAAADAAARSPAAPPGAARGANATAIGRRAVPAPAPAPAAAVRRAVATTPPVPLRDASVVLDEGADDDAPELDAAFDEAPPATADSPEVHRAWLQRIRELRDAGRMDEARESLDELRRRFPDLRVPDDLQPLGRQQSR